MNTLPVDLIEINKCYNADGKSSLGWICNENSLQWCWKEMYNVADDIFTYLY